MFDPVVLQRWRPEIHAGTDLFTEFITTATGDEVLERGIIVPVLAIDDGGYDVVVRASNEPSPIRADVLVENGELPLYVERDVVLADLAVLRHWLTDVGWMHVPVATGNYAVTVRGFRKMSADGRSLESAGYEFVLDPRERLPAVTGTTARNMRVMNWWDAK